MNSIRDGIYNSTYRYTEADNKYMKNFDTNKESLSLMFWDVNN